MKITEIIIVCSFAVSGTVLFLIMRALWHLGGS